MASRETTRRPTSERRTYPAVGPEVRVPAARPSLGRPNVAAVVLVLTAVVVVALVRSAWVRSLLPLALVLGAAAITLRTRKGPPPASVAPAPPARALELEDGCLALRLGASRLAVMDLREPFGLTLFATHARDRVVALLSARSAVFYVGAGMGSADALGALLDRASTVALDEPALDALAPDGQPFLLAPHHLARLIRDLLALAPDSFDRIVTTDARGQPVLVDVGELRVGAATFDLDAPLEWKAIVFQEPLGAGVAVFQGTWVRQSGSEVVLVSSLSLGAPLVDPSLDANRALERDLRLMQAQVEDPPAREKRFAIDRMMMMPLRSALLRAPRRSVEPRHAEA